jgi:cell division protein FtsQ
MRFLFFLFFLAAAGIVLYYILSLPIWKIEVITVDGANLLSADEIRDLSGIPLSENLFMTSFARARSNLKKISAIAEFHLYRIPPGTVLIRIRERKPIAVIVFQNRSVVIDDEGYILNRNPNLSFNVPNLTELPVVSGVQSEEAISTEKIDPAYSKVVRDIISELSSLFGSRRIHLDIGAFKNISLLLDDILRVKIGRGENIQRKMEVFKALLPVINNRWSQIEYVDVRFPDNPVIFPKQ